MGLQAPETFYEEQVIPASRVNDLFPDFVFRKLLERGALRAQPDGTSKVQFVGVATAGGRSFQFVPKIFDQERDDLGEVMRQVVRALRKYSAWMSSTDDDAPLLRAASQPTGVSALAMADWIIREYLTNGIYRRARQLQELDGAGQILWSRTIDRLAPVVTGGRPVYLSVITRASANDAEHFVSRLHRHLIDLALARYGHLLGYSALSLEHEPFEPFSESPPLGLSLTRLRQEMREAYSDRALRLLPMMMALLEETSVPQSKEISLYGTSSFYHVWERACATLIGNQLSRWQHLIPRPKWYGAAGQSQVVDTFIPDVVRTFESAGERWLLIADAKYYRLRLPPSLAGYPGVNDVAKQLWYERCLAGHAADRGFNRVANIFVVPGQKNQMQLRAAGSVELASFGAQRVGVTWLDALPALRDYADGRTLPDDIVAQASRDAMRAPALQPVI